jgi:hypothetical protein
MGGLNLGQPVAHYAVEQRFEFVKIQGYVEHAINAGAEDLCHFFATGKTSPPAGAGAGGELALQKHGPALAGHYGVAAHQNRFSA